MRWGSTHINSTGMPLPESSAQPGAPSLGTRGSSPFRTPITAGGLLASPAVRNAPASVAVSNERHGPIKWRQKFCASILGRCLDQIPQTPTFSACGPRHQSFFGWFHIEVDVARRNQFWF